MQQFTEVVMATNTNHLSNNAPMNMGMSGGGQLDLGSIYGISDEGSSPWVNFLSPGYQIPSLEQIAAFNQAANPQFGGFQTNIPTQEVSQMPESSLNDALMQPDPNQMFSPITQQDIEQTPTPANTLPSAATLSPTVEADIASNPGIITDFSNPYPVTSESIQFLNGFIRTQIGRRVSIDFLVGSNSMVTKSGYLLGVATNYILINELDSNDITACDFFNIKFIRFYY